MTKEDISQEFKFKKSNNNNYFIKEIDQNELLSNKNKKVCTTLNYTEHFAVTKCVSISAFKNNVIVLFSKRKIN